MVLILVSRISKIRALLRSEVCCVRPFCLFAFVSIPWLLFGCTKPSAALVVPEHRFCNATRTSLSGNETWNSSSKPFPPEGVPICLDIAPKGGVRLEFTYEYIDSRGEEDATGAIHIGEIRDGRLAATLGPGETLSGSVAILTTALRVDFSSLGSGYAAYSVDYSCVTEAGLQDCDSYCCALRK